MREIGEMLRAHGLRCTRQREIVYGALRASRGHPTAEELLEMVRREDWQISLATVYNTLDALCERGLVRRMRAGGGAQRFDAVVEDHAHVELDDGRILDVPAHLDARLRRGVDAQALEELALHLGVEPSRLRVRVSVSVV